MKLYLAKYILPISSEPIQNGAILVHKDRIHAVGNAETLKSKYPEAEIEDLDESILLPGLVNAHTHLELSRAEAYHSLDYADPSGEANFVRWLIATSKYQDSLKPEDKRSALEEGLRSLRQMGITCVGDLTSFDGAFPSYENSNLRIVTYAEVMNINQKITQDRFESALAYVDEIMNADHPKIKVGLAPFAPYTLSKNLLKIFYQHLKTLQIPLQIHCSQSFAEMEFFYDSKGDIANLLFPYIGWGDKLPPPHQKTPIQYLHGIDFLQIKPALVGCVHMGPTDLALIANSGSSIIYTPKADSTLRLGQAPLAKIIAHKIPTGIGSDSLACNSTLSIWDEMRKIKELHANESEHINPQHILMMATLGGAHNLGLQKEIGSLEKGKLADFISLEIPENTTLENVIDQTVQKGGPELLRKVFVGGEELN